jgi:hypothetical protein
MALQFSKATKKRAKLRLALMGPAGFGKTYTALAIGETLGKRIAVIDSERGSSELYSDRFNFDVLTLDTFSPQHYIDAIYAAEKAGYDVLIIDSLSHAWSGIGGALEMVDNVAARSRSQNRFTAWRDVTPVHNAMVDAIIRVNMHVIVTMRVKTEYTMEKDEKGKTVPVKIGLQPIQRDGLEYEFTVVADLHENHSLTVSKTRCPALDGKVFRDPGRNVGELLLSWLESGEEAKPQAPVQSIANGTLESALKQSVAHSWPKWTQKHVDAMTRASQVSPGALAEAWNAVNEEKRKLSPPTEYVDQLRQLKDQLKQARINAQAAEGAEPPVAS